MVTTENLKINYACTITRNRASSLTFPPLTRPLTSPDEVDEEVISDTDVKRAEEETKDIEKETECAFKWSRLCG